MIAKNLRETFREICGFMAVDCNGGCGNDGKLPWDIPEELQFFRDTTAGQIVIMGRKTYEGIPPIFHTKRTSIVITSDPNFKDENVIAARSIGHCMDILQTLDPEKKVYMIGGAKLAEEFLNRGLLSHFNLTRIHREHDADVYLNLRHLERWGKEVVREGDGYTILRLTNPKPVPRI